MNGTARAILAGLLAAALGMGCTPPGHSPGTPGTMDCVTPSRCDYPAWAEAGLREKVVNTFDGLEMGGVNPSIVLDAVQQLEFYLRKCPRITLPMMIRQIQEPVAEVQRQNIAFVFGKYPEGAECTIPVLRKVLRDRPITVRYSAAAALAELGESDGLRIVVDEALIAPNFPGVRDRALALLEDLAGRSFSSAAAAQAYYRQTGYRVPRMGSTP